MVQLSKLYSNSPQGGIIPQIHIRLNLLKNLKLERERETENTSGNFC